MGKEKEKNLGPPGTGSSLIYRKLPPLAPSENTSKHAILLRHFVAWQLRKLLWLNATKMKENSLSNCMCSPTPAMARKKDGEVYSTNQPGHIQIHKYCKPESISEVNENQPGHGYVGLQKCASAMRCPVCGARIRYVRRNEISDIARKMIKGGYSFLFQTLTAPHDFKTEPALFIKMFQEANRELKKTRSWKLFSERWQIKHYIRAVEVTDDKPDSKNKTGIHFHSHSIIFSERPFFTEIETKRFRNELAALWFRALKKVGIACDADRKKVLINSVDVKRPCVKEQGELSDPALIEKLIEYVCKGASFEMSPSTIGNKESKQGKSERRISHWELMRIALTEDEDQQPRLLSIMEALKGVAHLYFSPGLKAFCGIEDVSDQKIVEGVAETLVYAFDNVDKKKLWKGIRKHGNQKPLLVAIDSSPNVPVKFLVDIAGHGIDPITGEVAVSSP